MDVDPSDSGLRVPFPFGDFLVLKRLGAGGMGEVFIAKQTPLGGLEKYCVLKMLRTHASAESEYMRRFLDEARVVVRLTHRNICPVYEVGQVDGRTYIAMEYIAGVELASLQQRAMQRGGNLSAEMSLYICGEILEALDYAHRSADPTTGEPLRIVHRDVSPANIMVNFEGEPKLIDFGLAESQLKLERTAPRVVMGKLAYMAPEQARGELVDPRADIFSTGVLLYELLTGERYYEAKTVAQLWEQVYASTYRPRSWMFLDDEMKKIMARALAPKLTDRYQSGSDFRDDLVTYQLNRRYRAGTREIRAVMEDLFADERLAQREMLVGFSKLRHLAAARKRRASDTGGGAAGAQKARAAAPPVEHHDAQFHTGPHVVHASRDAFDDPTEPGSTSFSFTSGSGPILHELPDPKTVLETASQPHQMQSPLPTFISDPLGASAHAPTERLQRPQLRTGAYDMRVSTRVPSAELTLPQRRLAVPMLAGAAVLLILVLPIAFVLRVAVDVPAVDERQARLGVDAPSMESPAVDLLEQGPVRALVADDDDDRDRLADDAPASVQGARPEPRPTRNPTQRVTRPENTPRSGPPRTPTATNPMPAPVASTAAPPSTATAAPSTPTPVVAAPAAKPRPPPQLETIDEMARYLEQSCLARVPCARDIARRKGYLAFMSPEEIEALRASAAACVQRCVE